MRLSLAVGMVNVACALMALVQVSSSHAPDALHILSLPMTMSQILHACMHAMCMDSAFGYRSVLYA